MNEPNIYYLPKYICSHHERAAYRNVGLILGLIADSAAQEKPSKWLVAAIREEGLPVRRTLKRIRDYLHTGDIARLYDDGSRAIPIYMGHKAPWLSKL